MKTEIRVTPHSSTPGASVVELWYDGKFIGQVTGHDGPGVRIISKYLANHLEAIFVVLDTIPFLVVKLDD